MRLDMLLHPNNIIPAVELYSRIAHMFLLDDSQDVDGITYCLLLDEGLLSVASAIQAYEFVMF